MSRELGGRMSFNQGKKQKQEFVSFHTVRCIFIDFSENHSWNFFKLIFMTVGNSVRTKEKMPLSPCVVNYHFQKVTIPNLCVNSESPAIRFLLVHICVVLAALGGGLFMAPPPAGRLCRGM